MGRTIRRVRARGLKQRRAAKRVRVGGWRTAMRSALVQCPDMPLEGIRLAKWSGKGLNVCGVTLISAPAWKAQLAKRHDSDTKEPPVFRLWFDSTPLKEKNAEKLKSRAEDLDRRRTSPAVIARLYGRNIHHQFSLKFRIRGARRGTCRISLAPGKPFSNKAY